MPFFFVLGIIRRFLTIYFTFRGGGKKVLTIKGKSYIIIKMQELSDVGKDSV